jgi:hypothetical protein
VRVTQGRLHRLELRLGPERRELAHQAPRDGDGPSRRLQGPRPMRHARTLGARSTRTLARATPPRMLGMRAARSRCELCRAARHLVLGLYITTRTRVWITAGDRPPRDDW